MLCRAFLQEQLEAPVLFCLCSNGSDSLHNRQTWSNPITFVHSLLVYDATIVQKLRKDRNHFAARNKSQMTTIHCGYTVSCYRHQLANGDIFFHKVLLHCIVNNVQWNVIFNLLVVVFVEVRSRTLLLWKSHQKPCK